MNCLLQNRKNSLVYYNLGFEVTDPTGYSSFSQLNSVQSTESLEFVDYYF